MIEKQQTYRSKLDVKRLYYLVTTLFYLRDYFPALSKDLGREVEAIRLQQQS
jgi:hypothetical protein